MQIDGQGAHLRPILHGASIPTGKLPRLTRLSGWATHFLEPFAPAPPIGSLAAHAQGRAFFELSGHALQRIIAAGGTHALVPTHRIAVLGNVLTAPEARGQGDATAITAALVAALFDQQFSLVVLNVFEDNSTAIRIYQRLGSQTHHQLLTGKASRSP